MIWKRSRIEAVPPRHLDRLKTLLLIRLCSASALTECCLLFIQADNLDIDEGDEKDDKNKVLPPNCEGASRGGRTDQERPEEEKDEVCAVGVSRVAFSRCVAGSCLSWIGGWPWTEVRYLGGVETLNVSFVLL